MKYVYELGKIPEDKVRFAGGKAMSLHRMISKLNVNVPEGYVITAEAFEACKVRPDADAEIEGLIRRLDPRLTYAVRSSALNEDGANASFAGQYETLTDVNINDIRAAVDKVAGSADSSRVREYTGSFDKDTSGIAVVIQRFIKPLFAGVIFTSDVMTGKDDKLVGNFVAGEGEQLVSGESNAKEFTIDVFTKEYTGSGELKRFAPRLHKYCTAVRRLYGMPMDIEWACAGSKTYILQARPITTLRRLDMNTYDINGSMSGYKLLTKTNVGEIFMQPVSPMTFSVLEKINDMLGLPDWLDNICGQPYMNISVMCSLMVAFGKSKQKAFEAIRSLAGNIPDGVEVPLSPFDKKAFRKKIFALLFPKNKSKLTRKQKHIMVQNLAEISRDLISEIRKIDSAKALIDYWDNTLIPRLNDGLASILTESGTSLLSLFKIPGKITKVAGEEMSRRLCGGGIGTLDSMKPLLLLEDVITGRISRDEYVRTCGHRCINEMELMEPRPYEDPSFIDRIISDHMAGNVSLHAMQDAQRHEYENALAEFKSLHPSRSKWIDKQLAKFAHGNNFREDIRSKGVYIFCVFREFLLRAGALNDIGDDVFMLTYKEALDLLRGDYSALASIPARKDSLLRYRSYPMFPSLVLGRFEPSVWLSDEDRRTDFYCADKESCGSGAASAVSDVKGFPGARGIVRGTVRVITDVKDIGSVRDGEILVTVATNIGWTLVFPRVAAVVTDIGAPLSHAAIVAREFGIPAVVGCGNATTVLKTGDAVEVDGAAGTVRKIY